MMWFSSRLHDHEKTDDETGSFATVSKGSISGGAGKLDQEVVRSLSLHKKATQGHRCTAPHQRVSRVMK